MKSVSPLLCLLLSVGVVVCAIACDAEAPTPLPSVPGASTFATVPTYAPPTCTTPPPTLCDWVNAHDVVATARILSAEASWQPAAVNVGGVQEFVDPDTCLSLEPALHLRVKIIAVHAGDDVGGDLDVYIGAKHPLLWNQRVTTLYPNTPLRFSDAVERFQAGNDLVLTAFDVGSGYSVWTALPSVDADNVLTFPAACDGSAFAATGMTATTFFAAAAACDAPTAEAVSLRAAWDAQNAPQQGRLTSWRAAQCYLRGGS